MLPSLASLGFDTAVKRKLGEESEEERREESEEERNVRLFREFLNDPPQIQTFDGSSIDPAKLLADMDRLLLGKAVVDKSDDEAWLRAFLSFFAKHPQYAAHYEEMRGDMDVIGDIGQSHPYITSLPLLSKWTDEELRFARFAVERAFSRSMGTTDTSELGPQTFNTMPPKTFWSLWQMRRMNCVLTIGDVVRMRSTKTAIAVIPEITQQHQTAFKWLTATDRGMFSAASTPIGNFYPHEPWKPRGASVKWEDYATLKSEGRLDELFNAYAVSGNGADLWIKLSPELIGLAYGWMAQVARASIASGVEAPPSWLDAIEQGEEGEFPIPGAAELFGELALKYAINQLESV
jgi:hypothetical protein